ncbi:MAG: hypothetical protein PUF08_03560 [Clostridiales bacterium]|nr:hypothetical protein [Clostridiales bacterium]
MISRPLTPPCVPFGTRRWLINSFLNSVYLFDDKIIIDCNYKDGTETITFEEIENSSLGSDLTSLAVPNKTDYLDRIVGLFFFIKNAQILQYCGILRFLQILNE